MTAACTLIFLPPTGDMGTTSSKGLSTRQRSKRLRRDAQDVLERAPVTPDAKVDAQGRPALGLDCAALIAMPDTVQRWAAQSL